MNHKLPNKTLKEGNRKLRAEIKRVVVVDRTYTQALYKLEKEKK